MNNLDKVLLGNGLNDIDRKLGDILAQQDRIETLEYALAKSVVILNNFVIGQKYLNESILECVNEFKRALRDE